MRSSIDAEKKLAEAYITRSDDPRSTIDLTIMIFSQHLNCTSSIPRDLNNITNYRRAVLHTSRFCNVVPEGLHVPSGGGTAFGTEAAVEANIFVLDHDATGF